MAGRYSLKNIWDDLALPELALSFKLAIGPTKMILAFCAVFTVCAIGFLMDTCTKSVVVSRPIDTSPEVAFTQTELDVFIVDPDQVMAFITEHEGQTQGRGVFVTLWSFTSGRFHDATIQLLNFDNANLFANFKFALYNFWLCIRAVGWAFRFHVFYSLIYFACAFFVFSIAGGAISRCAALEFAQDEKPGLFEAFQYARDHYRSFISAPLIPLGMVALFSLIVFLVGILASVPWVGEWLLVLSFLIILFFGVIITLLGIGIAAGSLLLYPSIAYEGTTGYDSIGRAFSYVLNRPVWMFYYVSMAAVFGTFFYLIFRLMIFIVLRFTHLLLYAGMSMLGQADKLQRIWARPEIIGVLKRVTESGNLSESGAAFAIYLFLLAIVGVLLSYIVSYVFSSATVIYALMRKKVDAFDTDAIHVHLEYIKE
ncbi:MAG: hypothetical protein ACYTET_02950 [Planctomycetota bacterium]